MKVVVILLLVLCSLAFQQLTVTVGKPSIKGTSLDSSTGACEEGHSYTEVKRVLQVAGSNLPDCSHACGSCTPCTRVIVGSPKCPIQTKRAESCPVSYRCMCKGKSYPVP